MERAIATTFLADLFADAVGPAAMLCVWSLPGKHARFFDAVEPAAEYAVIRADDSDVYFGAGLYRPGITHGRGKAADVVCITSLWADVDFGSSKSGKVRPPDREAALELVEAVGVKPSIIVNSGHGLHVYWRLIEPVTAEEGAADLARRWSDTIVQRGLDRGWAVDAVGDLSRVLRVPGTVNRKGDNARPVSILAAADHVYTPDDIEPVLIADTGVSDPAGTGVPEIKLAVLLENDPEFARAWNHDRTDLPDGSPSSYDLSLATRAAGAGWTDDEIAAMIRTFRRRHRLDEAKAARSDYLTRTISKARLTAAKWSFAATTQGDKPENAQAAARREQCLESLRTALRMRVLRWVCYGSEYSLVIQDGDGVRSIVMGPISKATSQKSFTDAILDSTDYLIPELKGKWRDVLRSLWTIVEREENPEEGMANSVAVWLMSYTKQHKPRLDRHDAVKGQLPFSQDRQLWVHIGHLRRFIMHAHDERITRPVLAKHLRAGGFYPSSVNASDGESKERKNVRYWVGKWES